MALHWRILIGLALGALVGVAINAWWSGGTWASLGVSDPGAFMRGVEAEGNAGASTLARVLRFGARLNQFVGDLFVRCLRFIAIPIVVFSIITGVASLGDVRKLGRLGGKTLGIFAITSTSSATIGLLLSGIVRPGTFVSAEVREQLISAGRGSAEAAAQSAADVSIWRQLLDVVPVNPFAALAQGEMLQVIVLGIALGAGLTMVGRERCELVVKVFDALADAVLQLVRLLMELAPYAVFALMAPVAATMGVDVLRALAVYCVVVVVGLSLVLFVVYPLVVWVFTRRAGGVGYANFFRAIAPAQLLAFTSSSSAATLPVTMECTRDRLGVPEDIAGFVCPLGTTINMDGTAVYQAVAVTFLAQLFGVEMHIADQFKMMAFAVLISIGSPGLPGASVILMVVAMQAFGLPTEGIAIVLAVDRILDMCRTVVNVAGDATAAVSVAASEGRWARGA